MNDSNNADNRSTSRYFSSGVGQGNQHSHLVDELAPAIEFARSSLLAGDMVSHIVHALHYQGHSGIFAFICIFSEATDADIAELKSFGQWWSDGTGPTDSDACDAYAKKIRLHQRVTIP